MATPAVLYDAENWTITRGQEARREVNEMMMLIWMCGVTRRDNIRNENIRGTTREAQSSKNITENDTVVQPCERGTHSTKNTRCGHTSETRKRSANHEV